ncbi:MAG: TfuA-related McrA-glycine thioamidation protein [Methanomicrobiaceae archaeon]|nr:TfuA-related McrA-glycine thioamidation protein [Methanomicrobiaceae archaeon]
MQDVIVYLGPSLNIETAKRILPESVADYRPPVRRGDLEEAVSERPKAICIIDGLFFQDCSVGHREILAALKSKISVYGSSSMGALRACELDSFGMVGVGRIYEMYRDGVIESDDEVALACDPFSNEAVSDALVDMRINFERAFRSGVITGDERDILIKTASGIYYPNRTYRRVLKDAKTNDEISGECFERLTTYLRTNSFSQKEEDAREVLRVVGDIIKN